MNDNFTNTIGYRGRLFSTQKKSLVVIDLQNDITKNYKEIINNMKILLPSSGKTK
jgi:hypothetical protein